MKNFVAALVLSMTCFTASAVQNTADLTNLTPAQAAEIQKQIAEMEKNPTNVSQNVRKEAEAWGELGANMGKAMIGAAKEFGVAANDFAGTGLGKITVAIVAYKIIGQDLLQIFAGILVLVFGNIISMYCMTHLAWKKTYEVKPILGGLINKRYLIERTEHSSSGEIKFFSMVGLLVTWGVGCALMLV